MIDMRIPIISIGNSKGIRLPKAVLQQYGLGEELDLELRDGEIVLRPCEAPRTGWEDAFARYGKGAEEDGLPGDWPEGEGDEWN